MQAGNLKFVERIEKELMAALLDYVVPFLGSKIRNPKPNSQDNLEKIIGRPKITLGDIAELRSSLVAVDGKTKFREESETTHDSIIQNMFFARNAKSEKKYSVTITYEQNRNFERLKVETRRDGNDISSEITNENVSSAVSYKVKITYEVNYQEERLWVSYSQQLRQYREKFVKSREDMSERVPLKWLNVLPESIMGGVLGFTYLGDHSMGRRADLTGKTARMVDIHESIHTPDEYETRVLTDWIMEKPKMRYLK